jgi:SNF2 family DNA or RNA helicase
MGYYSSDSDSDDGNSKRGLSQLLEKQKILDSSTVLHQLGTKRKKRLGDPDTDSEPSSPSLPPVPPTTSSSEIKISNGIGFRQQITSSTLSSNQEQAIIKKSKMCLGDLVDKSEYVSPEKSVYDLRNRGKGSASSSNSSSSRICNDDIANKKTTSITNDDDEWMMEGAIEVDKSGCAIPNVPEKEVKAKKWRSGKKKKDGDVSDDEISKEVLFNGIRKDSAEFSHEVEKGIAVNTEYDETHHEDKFHPDFYWDAKQPERPFLLHDYDVKSHVNKYAAKFLLDHQVSGVTWLWGKYCMSQGAILGDDMGMGKTVTIAALLLAIYGKTGRTDLDIQV